MRKVVFIGSSTEALPLAEKIAEWLESFDIKPLLWNAVFELGDYTLLALERTMESISGAIFIFNSDDTTETRGKETKSVRDNVLFEYGYFAGSLSRDRVIFVCSNKPNIPSDFFGLTYLVISDNNEYTAKPRLRKWVDRLPLPRIDNQQIPKTKIEDLNNSKRKFDLRDLKVFHHPEGCKANSLAIKRRKADAVSITVNYVGENLPDYAGAYLELHNDNWEDLYASGHLRFDIKCDGDYAFQTIALEPKSKTRSGNNEIIRPYEIDLTRNEMSVDIPLKELGNDITRFTFMTELVFLFNSGIFQGSAEIEISNLIVEVA